MSLPFFFMYALWNGPWHAGRNFRHQDECRRLTEPEYTIVYGKESATESATGKQKEKNPLILLSQSNWTPGGISGLYNIYWLDMMGIYRCKSAANIKYSIQLGVNFNLLYTGWKMDSRLVDGYSYCASRHAVWSSQDSLFHLDQHCGSDLIRSNDLGLRSHIHPNVWLVVLVDDIRERLWQHSTCKSSSDSHVHHFKYHMSRSFAKPYN